MLRGIHKASANWIGRAVMGVVLGLIAISFGIWGIGDIFRGFGTNTVAKVGGTEIRLDTFRQNYQDRLQQIGRQMNRPILPDQAKALGLDRQLLGEQIAELALDNRAKALRLNVSDAEVAKQVTSVPDFRGINGQFDRARFDAVLRNMGYTEARFIAEQRRIMLRQQLLGTVSGEAPVPNTAVEAFNQFQNEERGVDFVTLGAAQAGDIADPTPEVLDKYFAERKVLFRAPEYRKITIAVLTPDDLAARTEVSDADLKKAYEERKARYETPERRHLKQIVFPTMDEAKAAEQKLSSGTTFDALAAERGLKDADVDLGTVAKSAVVDRDVANAAFALKSGEVSKPVQGRFGIAIVKVESIEPGAVKPFEEVAPDLKKEIALQRAKNEVTNVEEKIEDERLGGANLTDAAKKFGVTPRTIDAIDREGKDSQGNAVPNLPTSVDVLAAAFNAEVDSESEPLRVPNHGGYVWFNVDKITPARDRPLDEVKDKVVQRWRDDQITDKLRTKAKAMLDKIKAGSSFAEVVAAASLKSEWRPGIKRGTVPQGLSPTAVASIFKASKDGSGSSEGKSPTERILFHVTEVKVPTLDPQSADAKRIDEALKSRATEDLIAQYITKIEAEIGVTINQNALEQVTGSGAQN